MRVLQTTVMLLALLMAAVAASCRPEGSFDQAVAEAYALIEAGNMQEAQRKALQAEEWLGEDASAVDREALARLYGCVYYRQNLTEKADSCIRVALGYATETGDTSLMIINLFNLGLCETAPGAAISDFGRAADLARKAGNRRLLISALEKEAQGRIATGDFEKAGQLLDESERLDESNSSHIEIMMTRCRLWLAEGKPDSVIAGYRSINPDSLNVFGRLNRATDIERILTEKGDYRNALAYKDSVYMYTDSIRRLDGSRQVAETEREFHASIARKNMRFRILLGVSAAVVTVILLILYFVIRNLRLSRRQIELTDRISALNARIAELRPQEKDQAESDRSSGIIPADADPISRLIEEKCRLSLEVFRSLPQYGLLRKLNLIRNLTADNKAEMKTVYDVIIGRFSDCCSDLRSAFPGMTNDDCIFCVMNYAGCSREVISFAMGASDEALRRRKSRIKQKLPEGVFSFFFAK